MRAARVMPVSYQALRQASAIRPPPWPLGRFPALAWWRSGRGHRDFAGSPCPKRVEHPRDEGAHGPQRWQTSAGPLLHRTHKVDAWRDGAPGCAATATCYSAGHSTALTAHRRLSRWRAGLGVSAAPARCRVCGGRRMTNTSCCGCTWGKGLPRGDSKSTPRVPSSKGAHL